MGATNKRENYYYKRTNKHDQFHKIENKWSEQKCVKINRLHNIMYPKYKKKHHINLPFLGRLREYM